MGGISLRYVTPLASLVTIGIVIVDMFLIRHVTSRNHMFKGLVFISKKNGVNQMECHVHHWSHAQRAKIKETLEKTFAVLSKHTYKKEREEKREKQRLFRSF